MLVLNRRVGERLFIGDNIIIAVLNTKGRRVDLGISAPREIPVYREEIYHRIRREKQGENIK